MKLIWIILIVFMPVLSFGQDLLPFYYEKNLPLYGNPERAEEFYFEYHTQARAHYYNHSMEYDNKGRIKTHIKSNKGLLNLDSIPLPFHEIVDPRAITITYSFLYDSADRLSRFSRHQFQEEVGSFQQDEEWVYDQFGMLYQHNFWDINNTDTVLKNPSVRRVIYRDSVGRVTEIEKKSYNFNLRDLAVTEISEYLYDSDRIDSVFIYRINNGTKALNEKRYNIKFERYNDLNTDSILYKSYKALNGTGEITVHEFNFDASGNKLTSLVTSNTSDTISYTEWIYEPFKVSESTDGYTLETHYDETGYERYNEEYRDGYLLYTAADFNSRTIEDGKIQYTLLEIWDPVTMFYRKDTEYIYYYDVLTSLQKQKALNRFQIYPNPASGVLYIENPEGIIKLELLSTNGWYVSLPLKSIITLDAPIGMYILKATFQDGYSQRSKVLITN